MKIMVGIYARLSVEHGNEKDQSLEQQIRLAREWLRKENDRCDQYVLYDVYTDLGYSGTTFARPAFQRMLADAGEGKIQYILCKDASRIGRDYLKTGEYLEKIFPLLGVKVVCISDVRTHDRADREYEMPGSFTEGLRNLMNEWYAKDIGRRVRLVKQQKKEQGEYLGSMAPYGWQIRYEAGRRVLVEDDALSDIISFMRLLRQKGMSYRQIAEILDQRGVNSPKEYQKSREVYRKRERSISLETPERRRTSKIPEYRTSTETPEQSRPPEMQGRQMSSGVQTLSRWDASGVRRILLSHTRGDYHPA